ncbi:MAG: ATP-binding cassette domain-containing protein, partial [Acidimicrobiia bacterium]|nr:ATP-binding cassette domain-containing protein [Acidimicrobiia bacterium]
LDEITAALTPDQADHVFDVMNEWKAQGRSVLFISHRLGEVLEMCDTATILRNGRDVAHLELEGGAESELVTAMLGEELAEEAGPEEEAAADDREPVGDRSVVLELRGVSLRDKVKDVSFQLHKGEILGLTALEGQGQDDLFKVLSGDHRPTEGEMLIDGEVLNAHSPYDAISRGVVFVPADRQQALLPQQSVRDNLASPLYNTPRRWFGLASDEGTRVQASVDRLDIDVRAGSQVQRLSGGNQQKVTIGKWLTAGFETLLCFDPTRGIDIQTKAQIYDLLRELAAGGSSILLYTSEFREIPMVCDRVLVMYGGRIVHEQPAATATEEVLLTAAHGLQEAST